MTPAAASSVGELGARKRRFPKSHRLKRRRLIRSLFDRNDSRVSHASAGSIRAVFRVVSPVETPRGAANIQAGFFVGRNAGNAVDRNRIRRHMREAFRLGRDGVVRSMSQRPGMLALGLVFRGSRRDAGRVVAADVAGVLDIVKNRLEADMRASAPAPESG